MGSSQDFPNLHGGVLGTAARQIRYAGFWIRAFAHVIDSAFFLIILSVPFAFFIVFIQLVFKPIDGEAMRALVDAMQLEVALITLGVGLLYYGFFSASAWQATPGKKLLGLHIIRADGRSVRFGVGMARYLAYFLSSMVLGLGFLSIAWSDQKKGFHDLICGTRVVYGKPQKKIPVNAFENVVA